MMNKLLWLLGPFALIYVVIAVFSIKTDAIFGCGQKVTNTEASPSKTKVMYWVSRDCGATTIPLVKVYIVPEKKSDSIDAEGRKISKKYLFMSYERGSVSPKWLSDDSIEVLYDHSELYGRKGSFFKQKNKLGNVKVTYRKVDFHFNPKKILEICPSVIEELKIEIPELVNSQLRSKIFDADILSQPTNYHEYVEKYGTGRDYFCNLDDTTGGVGWMIFVRINSNNGDYSSPAASPLFVETRFEAPRKRESPLKGKIIWQAHGIRK